MGHPLSQRHAWATPLVVYAVLAAGIGAAAWVYLTSFQRDLKAQVERELSSIAEFKVSQLVDWREAQKREWSEFRGNAFVEAALRRAVAGGEDRALRRELAEALEARRDRLDAVAALLLDASGRVVAAAPGTAAPTARELETVRRALRSPAAVLDEGEPGDDLAVAVSIDPRAPGVGAVLVRYETARAVSSMVLHWPHPASTAEPVLVRRAGDFIVPVTRPLHTAAPRLPLSLDIPTARAVRGETGIVECDDYRGIPIIAALRHVPDSSWYLSVKVDRAEVFAPGRKQALAFGVATLLLLTLAGAGVRFWWRAQVSAIERRGHALEEQSLRDRFHALWSQANDIVTVFEPGGHLVEANDHALAAYGYTREEFRGLSIEDLRAEGTRGDVGGQMAEVLRAGAVRFETVHRRKDGATFPAEVSAARLQGPDGPLVLSVTRDVGERQAAEAAARYQATLLENLNDAVIGLDLEARITAWAGAAERLYGYTAQEALGWRIEELLGGELPEDVGRRIEAEIARTGRCRIEVRHARKGGEPVDIEVTSVAVRGAGGEPAGFVAVHRDIGDRKRAEAEQRRLHAELVFADRLASIGTLAAGVAHEINNPLAFLIANLEYLKKEATPAEPAADESARREALEDACEGARRIGEIVRGLRAFSRRDGDSPTAAVDLRKAVSDAARMAEAQARPRARLVLELGETPPVVGRGHELAQVVLNLVINAIQAVPEGRPEENEVRVTTRVGRAGQVELVVADTGVGIPPEHLARIFDPFFTTKGVGEGSGLGLSICHGIVEGMGGTIAVESELGGGTTFTVRLPSSPPVQEDLPLRPRSGGRRGRILVLDDEPLVCGAVRRSLEQEHDVETSCDPRAAVERLAAGESFDLVLCDLAMPHMTGMECFEELVRRRPDMASRMIFLTGGAFTPSASRFLEENPGRCLEKPFEPGALRARIGEALAEAERRAQPAG